jgi:hypothetical protein
LWPQPHEFEALALLGFQALGAGFGAMTGFIAGGVLAGRYFSGDSPGKENDRLRTDR